MDGGEPRQNWVEGVPVSLYVLSPNWQRSVREQTENSLAVKVLLNTRNFSPGHLLQFCYDHTRVTCRATGREVIIHHVGKCGLGRTPQGWAGLPRAGEDLPGLGRTTQAVGCYEAKSQAGVGVRKAAGGCSVSPIVFRPREKSGKLNRARDIFTPVRRRLRR